VTSGMAALDGSIPDPARPPQGCSFRTRCPVAQPECGWEVDDIVRRLEHKDSIFNHLKEVVQPNPFNAEFTFETSDAASELNSSLQSDDIPSAMSEVMDEVKVNAEKVIVSFKSAQSIPLVKCGNGSMARCVLINK